MTSVAEPAVQSVEYAGDRGAVIKAVLARPPLDAARGGRPEPVEGRPQQSAPAPAVVLLHEWWGLNEQMTATAQRFAQEGFVALAPNLYSRQGYKVTQDPAEAGKLMEALSSQLALRDLNAGIAWLRRQPFVDPLKVGMVGYSMGGSLSLTMAGHNSDLKAAVCVCGKTPPIETFRYFLCPILHLHAAKDGWVTRQEVARLKEGLAQQGKPGEVIVYPDADHAFYNERRPEVYREADARDAWQRTVAFLRRYLLRPGV